MFHPALPGTDQEVTMGAIVVVDALYGDSGKGKIASVC